MISEAVSVISRVQNSSSKNPNQSSSDNEIEVDDANSIGKVDVQELQQVLGEGSPKNIRLGDGSPRIPKLERGGSFKVFNFNKKRSF